MSRNRRVEEALADVTATSVTRFVVEVEILKVANDEAQKQLAEDFKASYLSIMNRNSCVVSIVPRELDVVEMMGASVDHGQEG